MQATNTVKLISIDAIGAAVVDLQAVDAQEKTIKATKNASRGVLKGAIEQNSKIDGIWRDLTAICEVCCVPKTTGRMERIVKMREDVPSLSWEMAYSMTSEDAMTDKNKTAAYNNAKVILKRLKDAEAEAAKEAAAAQEAAEQEAAEAEATKQREAEAAAAKEAAEAEAAKAAAEAAEAIAAAEAAAQEAAKAAEAAAAEAATKEQEIFALKARIAELEADNATLTARLEAANAMVTKQNVTKAKANKKTRQEAAEAAAQ